MKTLGITMGDPLGIGAEIICKSLPKFLDQARFIVFGDRRHLSELERFSEVKVVGGSALVDYSPKEAGKASVSYLDQAMAAYRRGEIQALVTAPISKAHVHLAGFPFPGHTEYLAAQTQSEKFVMMMAGPKLKVTLVTIHEPLAKVPSLLSEDKIVDCIAITYQSLQKRFHLPKPRVAVCGLNPHAGEEGLLGNEEQLIIAPALEKAKAQGYEVEGPKVPDAVFHEAYEGQWDAVICMYHDQGLIPFKMLHFKDGVNVTLGLPLIRTSPDHGTAFDIAGRGIADSASMEAAIALALEMVERKNA